MDKENSKKVRFGDLSVPIKIAVISAWVVGIVWSISISVGIIYELLLVA